MFLQHRRKGKVAKLLNAAGYRTRGGVIWHDSQVYRLLTDPSAKGIYYFNRMRQLEKSWQTVPKPENKWGKVECQPIISEVMWNQVNQIIEDHTKSWKRPGRSPVHLFGSLAHCACGEKMYVRAGSPKYVCRKCCNKIPIVDLEAIFHQEMKSFFAQPKRIAKHLQEASRNLVEKTAVLDTHKREIQKVREEMHQTHQLYLQKQISGDGFHELYAPAEERLNQLQTELPKLEAEVDFMRVNKLSADDILLEANSLYDKWPEMPLETKRKIAESLVEKIVIGDGEIDINFSSIPSSGELCKNQQGLIALLAFTQRQIHASRAHIPLNRNRRRSIPTVIKTLGDYIQAKRYENGLHPYQAAGKMGIETALILAWESGTRTPDEKQWQMLSDLLSFDSGVDFPKPHRGRLLGLIQSKR